MMSSSSSTEEEQKLSNGNVKQAEYLKKFDLAEEAMLLLKISVPSVAVQFGLYFIFPQTASVIGRRLGSEELAGFSLASLTGNLTCLSVMVGALSANDTLMPRAYGTGRLSEVGILAIRGFLVCLALLIVPMVPLCTVVDAIFDALGQDPIAAELASRWIRIYLLGVPFVLLFRTTQRFLAAQHLVMPLVFGGLISCIFIHPFLLSIFIPRMGFLGSGFAIVATQTSQILLVFVYLHLRPVYHPDTWKGLSLSTLKEAVRPEPMMGFLRLSLGGVFALSEWWFWETTCFIVGHMGVVPLCVHSIAYNLVPVMYMIPLGLGIGLAVRMGNVLADSVSHAKKLAASYVALTAVIALIAGSLLYIFQAKIVALFSTDEQVVAGCREIWNHLCIYIINFFIFGINSGIMRALGMQLAMAAIICGTLWLACLPTLLYVAIWQDGGVTAVWYHLPYFYFAMNVLMVFWYMKADWHGISATIRERRDSSVEIKIEQNERTVLIDALNGNP